MTCKAGAVDEACVRDGGRHELRVRLANSGFKERQTSSVVEAGLETAAVAIVQCALGVDMSVCSVCTSATLCLPLAGEKGAARTGRGDCKDQVESRWLVVTACWAFTKV